MDPRGALPTDTERSRRQGEVQRLVKQRLAHLRFPISKLELLEDAGDLELDLSRAGPVSLRDVLENIPETTLFASPAHVAEVVALNWEDLADVFRPGGGG